MRKYVKLAIFLVLAAMLVALNQRFRWSDRISAEGMGRLLQEHYAAAVFLYLVLTVVGCTVLAVPGITFAVIAGMLFGPCLGTLFCLIATTLGAMGAFLVGRFFLRDSIRPLLEKNPWLKKLLFDQTGNSDLVLLMITRLVPLFPYNLQNFAYGITDISFVRYSLYTFLFMAPGVAMFTVGSAGVTDSAHRVQYFIVAAVLVAAIALLGVLFKRKFLREEGQDGR